MRDDSLLADSGLVLQRTDDAAAIDTLRADVAMYRGALFAAVDQLHEQRRTIDRLRDELRDLRDERARLARSVFAEAGQ